jgi:hypothetical protein
MPPYLSRPHPAQRCTWQRYIVSAVAASALGLVGCGGSASAPTDGAPAAGAPEAAAPAAGETGTLVLRANGEDFVRQGFTSKDGWDIEFDNLFVALADLTAAQSDPPFDPEADMDLSTKAEVKVSDIQVVDLAEGDAAAEPVLVAELEAPAGRYNALAWRMVPAPSGPSEGYTLWMQGSATKDGQTVPFTIQVTEELAFTCGDFVGDERKGILEPGQRADLEATFHFDHLFGDGDAPADDSINTGALGFEPFFALAQNDVVEVDSAALQAGLSEADYTTFLAVLPSLGHVGEGHCKEVKLTAL